MSQSTTYTVIKSGTATKPWAVAKTVRGDTSKYKVAFFKFKADAQRDAAKRNQGQATT